MIKRYKFYSFYCIITIFVVVSLLPIKCFAGTPYNSVSSALLRANWTSSSAWASGNIPPVTGFSTNDVINISYGSPYQSIKYAGTLNFQAGSNVSLTVATGDTLIVDAITVTSGCNMTFNGVLIVNGNFTNNGGITIGNTIIVKGNVNNTGTFNSGTLYTFGTVTGSIGSTSKNQTQFNSDFASSSNIYKSVGSASSWSTFTWNGAGSDNNWATASNWSGGVAPSGNASENIIFAGSTRLTPNNNFTAGTTFGSISFASGAGNYTLSGNALTLTGGSTAISASNASNTMTINNNITFSTAAPTITSTSGGSLTLVGTIANGGLLITVAGTGTTTLSGVISGTGALTINTAIDNVTVASGVNTFSGVVTITIGGLRIKNASGLGSGTKTTVITWGTYGQPSLRLDGSGGNISLPSTLSFLTSSHDGNYGGIVNEAGNNTIAGNFSLTNGGGETRFLVNAGTLTVSGTITPAMTGRGVILDGVGNGAISGVFADGGYAPTLVKQGSGTWTLSNTNTFTGATTITDGTLVLNGNYSSSGFAISSGAVLELAPTSDQDYPTTSFTGAGTLRKTGSYLSYWGSGAATFDFSTGALIDVQAGNLTGGSWGNEVWTNNYSDLTVASGATFAGVEANVRVDAVNGAGSITTGYSAAGSIIMGVDNGSGTFTGVISNYNTGLGHTGAIEKVGSGTQTLSGSNTYTRSTTITAGTLKLGAAGVIPDGSAVTVTGTLDMNTFSETVGSITGSGTIDNVLGAGTPILTCGGDGTTTTFSGTIQNTTGTLSIIKTGSGTTTLSGGNNLTYDGSTSVSAGTLILVDCGALASGTSPASFDISSGAVLEFNANSNTLNIGSTSASGTVITGTGTLRKTGGWPLGLGNQAAFQSAKVYLNMTGGLIDIEGGVIMNGGWSGGQWTNNKAGLYIASGARFDVWNGNTVYIDALTGSGTVDKGQSGTSNIIIGVNNGSGTFSGIIQNPSGSISITKQGSGTQTLSGANTYSGTTTVSAGTLKLGASGVIPDGSAISVNGTLDMNSYSETVGSITGSGTIDNITAAATPTLTCGGDDSNTSFSGTIQNTTGTLSVVKSGTGTLTLSGANTNAKFYCNAGIVSITNTNALQHQTFIDGGTLQVLHNGTGNNGSISIPTDLVVNTGKTGTINVANNGSNTGNTVVFRSFNHGNGTLNTTGSNSYSVTLTSYAQSGGPAGTSILNPTTANLLIGSMTNSNAAHTVQLDGTSSGNIISGIISDGGGFALTITKANTSTWTLSGANTFTGGLSLNAGQLNSNNASAFGTGTITIANGTTIDNTSGGSITNSNNNAQTWNGDFTFTGTKALNLGTGAVAMGSSLRTITTSASTLTVGGRISGTGGLTKAGAGIMTLSNSGGLTNWTGTTTVNGGNLNLGSGGDAYSSTNWVINSGGTLTYTADNVIANNALITVNASGTLAGAGHSDGIGNIAGAGSITNYQPSLTLSDGSSPVSSTFSGDISGTSSIYTWNYYASSTGTQTLSGTNTYSGATSIDANTTIKLGSTSALGLTSGVTVNSGGVLDLNGINYSTAIPITINGTGISSGGAIKNSSSTASTYAGLITLGSASSIIAGIGDITISNAGTISGATFGLTLGGGHNGTLTSILGITNGTLTKQDAGTWTLSGANTFTGGVNLNAGQININNTSALGTGTFAIANGTTIDNTSGGSITNSNNNAQTWNGDFTFTGSNALNLGTGTVSISSTRIVTVSTSTLTVGGVISGSGGLTKSGNGMMALGTISSGSYWTGTTTVNAGTLQLGNPGGDHYVSTSWVINSGGTILYTANNVISNSAIITINSGGFFNMNSSYYDAVGYLAGGGNLTNLNSLQLDLPATGSGSDFSGVISGSGNINIRGQVGSGTQIFSGLNTYTGITCILNGTLSINTIGNVNGGASAIGNPSSSTNGTIGIGSTTTTGTLVYTGTAQTTDRVINLVGTTGGAVIDQSGTGLLKFSSAYTATGSGAKILTLQGSTAGTGEIAGAIVDGASSTATSLLKSGTGTWTLSGTNTYTGSTTINGGILAAGSTSAFGSNSAVTLANIASTSLNTTGYNNSIGSLTGGGSTGGNITLGAATLTIGNNNSSPVAYAGVISGTGAIIKTGTGTLILSGSNSYSGLTTINAGMLQLGANGGAINTPLGTTGAGTTVTSGAVFDLAGYTLGTAEPLSLNGTGITNGGAIINSGSSASYSGAITLGSDAIVNASNQITLSGTLSPNTYSLTKAGINSLVFSSNTISVKDLTISAGTLVGGSSTINLSGNFSNSGTFTCGTSSVNFLGTSAQNIATATFNNVTLNNSTSPATSAAALTGNITVNGSLTLSSGILTTGSYYVDLGSTGSISEGASITAPTSYVTGTLKATRALMQNVQNTFGGIGVDITEANVNNNSTVVTRITGTGCVGNFGSKTGIKRYFTIVPTTDISLNGIMVFHYYDSEITGHTEANIKIFKSVDNRQMWTLQNSTVDATNNKLTLTGITSFSDWTGSDAVNNSLPISLKSFEVNKVNEFAEIKWTTWSETNNALFSIERSQDGEQWKSIYTCDGAGTTTKEHRYLVTDSNPSSGINYYRLKQSDIDGKFTYFNIKSINFSNDSISMQIYPIPAKAEQMNIQISSFKTTTATIGIFDLIGQQICSGDIEVGTSPIQIKLSDICTLIPGSYYVIISNNNRVVRKKILVE